METPDKGAGRAKALAALVEIELGDVRDVDFVATTIKSDVFSGLPQTKGIRELLVLEEDVAAFLAGEEHTRVVTRLVGTVVIIELGNDHSTIDLDLLAVWLRFLDHPDDSNLDFSWEGCCLDPDHAAEFDWKVGKECHFRLGGWENWTIGQGESGTRDGNHDLMYKSV